MSKDPAFLFYYQDFLVGTDHMDNEEVGAYIRCLCHQAHSGSISEKHMKKICLTQDVHNTIKTKFKESDSSGNYVNTRLRIELEKRRKYSESRANNRKGKNKGTGKMCKSYDKHMENENENEDINEEVSIKGGKFVKPTIEEVRKYCAERKNKVDPNAWHDFYTSKGWMVGKNKMRDWKAAVRTWEKEDRNQPKEFIPQYEDLSKKFPNPFDKINIPVKAL